MIDPQYCRYAYTLFTIGILRNVLRATPGQCQTFSECQDIAFPIICRSSVQQMFYQCMNLCLGLKAIVDKTDKPEGEACVQVNDDLLDTWLKYLISVRKLIKDLPIMFVTSLEVSLWNVVFIDFKQSVFISREKSNVIWTLLVSHQEDNLWNLTWKKMPRLDHVF